MSDFSPTNSCCRAMAGSKCQGASRANSLRIVGIEQQMIHRQVEARFGQQHLRRLARQDIGRRPGMARQHPAEAKVVARPHEYPPAARAGPAGRNAPASPPAHPPESSCIASQQRPRRAGQPHIVFQEHGMGLAAGRRIAPRPRGATKGRPCRRAGSRPEGRACVEPAVNRPGPRFRHPAPHPSRPRPSLRPALHGRQPVWPPRQVDQVNRA